jgi:hypothetical protein
MSAKKAVAKKQAKSAAPAYKKGDKVKFIGWADEAPEGAEDIEEGAVGTVKAVSKDGVEVEIDVDGDAVLIPFNPEEIELAKSSNKKASNKKAVVEDEDEDEEEEEDEEDEDEDDSEEDEDESEDESEDEEDEEEEEEEEEEAEQSPGELADEDDTSKEGKAAAKALTKRAEKVGLDVNDYPTWVKAEKAIIKAEAKAEKASNKKPAKEEVEIIVTADVKKAMGSDPCSAALKLIESAERSYFTLGGILAVIDRDKAHEALKDGKGKQRFSGFTGFGDFCEEYLGVSYRKAKFLIAINQSFSAAGVTADKLSSIGWAKAKDLVAVVRAEPEKAEAWLEKAENMTREKLESAIKTKLQKLGVKRHGNATTVSTTSFSFRLFEDQGETVKAAIEKAKEVMDSENTPTDNEAFYHIVSEWLSFQE